MNTLLIPDPRDHLAVAHERGRRLRSEAAAERMSAPLGPRRALAASLRRAADRLDPAPLAWREALR
ncbi:MAG TPA: hypothetical protein VGQ15_04890 [Gaiellaceae bacterium]|jgi:hypothetical protein|nr:hypothetical protein [Gaiellaceae bacterium]